MHVECIGHASRRRDPLQELAKIWSEGVAIGLLTVHEVRRSRTLDYC
jgi:hypothetical protein